MFEEMKDDDVVIIDPLDTEAVTKSFQTVSAQKKHWRDKALDPTTGKTYKELLDEERARTKAASPDPSTKPDDPKGDGKDNVPPQKTPDAEWLFDNFDAISTLSPEERTELRQTAKELNVEPVKFIKSKAGQAQLDKMRSEKKSQGANPGPSNVVPTFNGKPIKDVFTDEKASKEDKQKAFEERMKGVRGANQAV